ncbi:Fatty-acid amide hydrolase 2-B [Araneus ventricosus]|uniref:Fatty-acid amide hydrolase 2-B n=1 Tax=Araneus ventricosus TaxID=182803 RepID=A0A4Y2LNN1_ARAVE|nr:Fatty-acid amide hydrolase 2-B [Araneus ventricosus]
MGIAYQFFQILSSVVRFIVHWPLALFYCRKGKVVPPIKNQLLLKSATQLAREIRDGKLKSADVVQAYIDRIQEVDPYINATVDRCFQEALKEAKEADLLVASGKYTEEQLMNEKPLLGVPISVKVLLLVKGLRCTGGSKLFENLVATEDAPSVALMKKAGAVVIATTNSPEFALNIETSNKVHGRTRNPYNTNRTPGGSSGS